MVTTDGTSCIRNLDWIVAWDDETARHVYMRDGDLAFSAAGILQVGGHFEGPVETELDGRRRLAIPGLIDIHAHPSLEPLGKGYYEDLGSHRLYMNRLYEFYMSLLPDLDGAVAATRVGIAELLRSGCTTVVDLGMIHPHWLDVLAETGIRAYLAPLFQSASWSMRNNHAVDYTWDEPAGLDGLAQAEALILAAREHPSGRLDGVFAPTTADTCSAALLEATKAAAARIGAGIQLHAAVNMVEFHEIVRRTGLTPVQWLGEIGFLGPEVTLAHVLFTDAHPIPHWYTKRDLPLLAETSTSVAHLPLVAAQRGTLMHSFAAYREAGINVAIGTDTYPMNMLEEMRWAGVLSKVATTQVDRPRTEHVFEAATIAAARALGRDDIGRLAVGAQADVVLVDLDHPSMIPLRDPLKNLIYTATDRPVRDVFVGARQLLKDREVVSFDPTDAYAAVQEAQGRALANVPTRDWAGRSADEIAPLTLPVRR